MISMAEIQAVLDCHHGLSYCETSHSFKGSVHVNCLEIGEHIVGDFPVSILLTSDYPKDIPRVYAPDYKLPVGYSHVFVKSGQLCLGTVADQRFFLAEGHSMNEWIDSYIIPFFFSAEYFRKYGISPFGERSHNFVGTLEYYQEIFEVGDTEMAFLFLRLIATMGYRGGILCPCGSGLRIRDCHRNVFQKYSGAMYKPQIVKDYHDILSQKQQLAEAIKEIEWQRR